jgi:hypothetical protein
VLCAIALASGASVPASAQEPAPAAPAEAPPKIPNEQLDSLVAPIALYPDPLLAQVLAASTYPLEIVQLQQWTAQHPDLKDQALVDEVEKQSWDASVQALAPLPDVVKLLASDITWTTDLGNAFLAQESDVMAAVQRMRAKAKAKGTLKSNDKIKVETQTVEQQPVVIIEQADPQVVYVPAYDPVVVYGAPPYPYPAIAYPPGYAVAGAVISFGVGVAVGAAFHGGWGWGCGWGGAHDNVVNVNRNNTFVRNSATRTGSTYAGGRGQWQHDPQHRGGAPYADRATAGRYGGSTGREGARTQRVEAAGQRPTGGERIGDRNVSPNPNAGRAREGDALGGGARGSYDGAKARASSERGSSSLGSRERGGGAPRSGGGGGAGGGARGGGGGGRRGGGRR